MFAATRMKAAFIRPIAMAVLLTTSIGPLTAKTRVEGSANDMYLIAQDAPIGEVLASLSARFNLTYAPTAAELDRAVTGTYSGTLPQVLGRLLDGYDYITQVSEEGIKVNVVGRSGSIARSASSPPYSSATAAILPPPPPPAFNPSREHQPPGHISLNVGAGR